MAKFDYEVRIHFNISFWDAIKFRIAGKEVREKMLEVKKQAEDYCSQKKKGE